MKKRIVTLLLTLLTILSLLPTAAMAAESTGVGITPVTDPNLWTTRLNSNGQSYSYRPPTAAGRQLYCMDLGYSYRYGTESFLQSYTYRSATGADADALWDDAVAETGLGEMDAITRENVKWMMSYIADYTGEIPGSLFMALQTYIWDNQSDKSAGGDPSGDIDAGGFANADTYDQYCWARRPMRMRNSSGRSRNMRPRASGRPSWRTRAPSGRCWQPPASPGGSLSSLTTATARS